MFALIRFFVKGRAEEMKRYMKCIRGIGRRR